MPVWKTTLNRQSKHVYPHANNFLTNINAHFQLSATAEHRLQNSDDTLANNEHDISMQQRYARQNATDVTRPWSMILPKRTAVVWSSLSGYWWKNRYSSNKFLNMHWNTSYNAHTHTHFLIEKERSWSRRGITTIQQSVTELCDRNIKAWMGKLWHTRSIGVTTK